MKSYVVFKILNRKLLKSRYQLHGNMCNHNIAWNILKVVCYKIVDLLNYLVPLIFTDLQLSKKML